MVNQVLVTSFSPAGARLYGLRMVKSVRRFWPASVRLVVYLDSPMPIPGAEVRLTSALPEWVACRTRWAKDPAVHGRSTREAPRKKPYSYRYDAARFAVKVFVQRDAAERLGEGILTWLDGDTLTRRPVPENWPASLLGDADLAYLGRGPMHPETGYVGFRIPHAWPVLQWCCEAYSSDAFRQIDGWTDCHILRAALQAVPVTSRDLTSAVYAGVSHIWPVSPLAAYVTHFKGSAQKRLGPQVTS
jgi:hypothetical protein